MGALEEIAEAQAMYDRADAALSANTPTEAPERIWANPDAGYCQTIGSNEHCVEYIRADLASSQAPVAVKALEIAETALSSIAHTFTEDSHGGMKTLPATEYQDIARKALSAIAEAPQPASVMEPLGAEFEAVWDANTDKLYESDPAPQPAPSVREAARALADQAEHCALGYAATNETTLIPAMRHLFEAVWRVRDALAQPASQEGWRPGKVRYSRASKHRDDRPPEQLWKLGDTILVWVNEGDLCFGGEEVPAAPTKGA